MTFTYRRSSFALYGWLLVIVAIMAPMFLLPSSTNEAQAQSSTPAKPTGLTAQSVSHNSVTLTWDDPEDSSITGYQVLRRPLDLDEYGDGLGSAEFVAVVDDTGTSATTYTDTSVAARTRYVYRVKAWNAQGLGGASNDADAETAEDPDSQRVQPCQEGYVAPTPTEVPVTAVPIMVESTTADYFVLYASHDVGGTTVEYPVRVVLGEDGTTTLSENVAPLPKDRYRVQKYSIEEPADVDGDCTDDITELGNLGPMNPVNAAPSIDLSDGVVALPDRETFEKLAYPDSGGTWHIKFVILDNDTDRPRVYFQNTRNALHHGPFLDSIGVDWRQEDAVSGIVILDPGLLAQDGSSGVYRFQSRRSYGGTYSFFERAYTLLAANVPFLADNLALWIRSEMLSSIQSDLPLYRSSRMNLVFDEDVYGDIDYMALNPGEGYGMLRSLDPDERPHSRDIVIYETLPNELPRVAGVMSTVPQTPLSHVNLRALQNGIPNAYIADALGDETISGLIDSHVYYAVTDTGYSIRAATQEEVDEHYASSRPAETQTPQRDLAVTSITPLSNIDFDDWDSFGVKAANVAVLRTLGFPEGTVPDGFAVPFYFYDEFMKHNNLYDYIEEMLADTDFQTDYDTKADKLKKLRKKIKKADTPDWIETALTEMHATFPEGTSLRYRSSTNNEDLPNFNGAGLYDSKTQRPEETEEDGISKSLKQVYASLWNFRAFVERDFHRIDHMAAAMGVLVHPNYSDEKVNGVAVSTDPAYGTKGTYYANSQVGEDLVTNPEAHSVPEEVLLNSDGTYSVVALSNKVSQGQLLMTDEQLGQLRQHLAQIHEKFDVLYGVEDGERFAIEIEFKIASDNILAIKQARPWVFTDPPPETGNKPHEVTGDALTAWLVTKPETHDGHPFIVHVRFSDSIDIVASDFRRRAAVVTGGRVTRVWRIDHRRDFWGIQVTPDSHSSNATLALAPNRPCTIGGAICTFDGRRLSNRLEHTVATAAVAYVDGSPGAPREVKVQAGDTELLVSWQPPAEENKAPVTQYRILYREEGGSNQELHTSHLSQEIGNLTNGVTYSVQVTAKNAAGYGTPSDEVSETPDTLPPWSADMLVVEYTENSIGAASADLFSNIGGTGDLEIGSLWSHIPDRDLRLSFEDGVPDAADYTLKVGDLTLEFPPGSSGNGSFKWTDVDVDWEDGQTISVSIVLTSALQTSASNTPATGAPTISGTAQVDETLAAETSNIADDDGLTNVSYSYQWTRSDGSTYADIAGETDSTYTLVFADQGKTIKVRVSFSDDADNQESLTSVATDTVAAKPNSRATGAPTINGTAQVGETLTVLTNGITDEDGLTNVSYSYQWIRSDNGTDADIAGQTASTYTLVSADQGKAIKVKVSFTDDTDHEETLTSAATAAVAARPNREATGAPTISGTAQAGETLTADTSGIADADGLTNVSFSYQWLRNDGTTDTDIQGATSSTYTLSDADEGKTIKVRVSFTDWGGYQETLTSTTTIIVDQPGTVSLWPEQPRVGTVVSATLTDSDGLEGAGSGAAASLGAVSWQWARSSEGSTWTSVDVYEDGDSYTPTEDDEGMWLKVTAVYTDGHGQGKSAEAITAATVGAREASPELTVTELVTGLTHPWDIAFTPDGTMLFTERDDGLRVRLTDGTVRQVTADFSDLNFGGTAGLLALVLDPDFVSNRRFYTYQRHTGAEMQLIAWTIDADYTAVTRVADPLVGGIPRNRNRGPSHGGGRLRFGPQGYLWVATGDGYSGTAAQDLSSLGGKVLRVDSQTGAGAPDNPFAPSPVYTYGHRNPQGLALRPGASQMWSVEHGPNHDDEINLLVSGGNYGWDPAPDEGAEDLYDETTTPMTDLVKFPDGLEAKWSSGYPTLAVGGGVFLEGSQWREWEGRFAVATLKTKSVRVFKFTEEGDLVSQVVVPELDHTYGRLRTAVLGPDGALYITTTNGGGKDKILKVVPANTPATGLPTISGTARVGETLTALTNGITDADGLTNVSYSYQWLADDANIQGATNSTYTLSDEDEGKSIKVRVSFTDDADNAETRTSEATDTVAATKPGVPGHMNVFPHGTGALDVYWEAPASDGGSAITGYKVRWKESADSWETSADVSEATVTGTTHTIMGLTGGVEYAVRVSAVNDVGEGSPSAEASGTPQEAQIWSANLTVGIVAETFAGYTTFLPDSSVLGALSSDTITLDDASYTVKALGVLNGKLILSVMPKLTTGFVLVVGTEEFASTDASTLEGDSIMQFQWNDPGLDLPEGEEVAVRVTEPAENTPATGEPTITGTTQVGETLTADTSEIQDSNGRINVIFEYQWMVTDTEIDDATESTYTPSASDVGKTISVRVNFRDDAGYKESVTSQATEVVAATVPTAPMGLTVARGDQIQELDASWQAPSSNGGSAVTGYKVQWKESTDSWDTEEDVSEATETGTTHTISGLTGGVEYAVRVIASNDVGDGPASTEVKGTPAGGVSEQTVEPENSAPTGLPSISGTPQVDQTLTADTSDIDDEDGLTNVSYRYQWGAGGSDIGGATGSSYTLTYSEQGQTIQVQVSFTDDADNEETLTSAATVAVAAAPNRGATGQPTISGTPQVDQTLTADTANIADEDGLTNPTFAYQWRGGGLTIIGATGSTYTLTASDQGKTITVRVRFTDDRNNIESRISNATTAVAAAPNTAPAGLPTISGTPQVEQTLTADTAGINDADGLTNVSFEYQWLAGGSDISGATGSSYLLTSSEQGQTIQVRVTFTDDADNQETLTSAATEVVVAKPDPLTVSLKTAAPDSHDGSSEFTFEIEFSEEVKLSYATLKNHAFNVTGGSVERAQRTDKPSNIPWRITVKPQGTGDVTIELPATTDCGAAGAICTGDGRKLSNSLNLTVSGPGQ